MYDVFLSCKSEDYSKAEPIYRWLVSVGYNPFFAPISLRVSSVQGEPVVFGDEIDDALEEVENMIVFTTNAEYVREGYVKDEWRTFVEEQRAGRKKGSLVTIIDGVSVGDLPIRLRSVQSFTPRNYQEGIRRYLGEVSGHAAVRKTSPSVVTDDLVMDVRGVKFKMVKVEGGTFTMGATAEQGSDAYSNEKPEHQVTLSDYYIGETQVTQELWKAVMGDNPSNWRGENLPVEQVSWEEAQEFIQKLIQKTGCTFRLPTEAEWEYAARGGKNSKGYKYSGSNSIDEVAWYYGNSGVKTHPVKEMKANELGLYDMCGNVREWCNDWYGEYSSDAQTNPQGPKKGSGRVLRGGSWSNAAGSCRVSYRNDDIPMGRHRYVGFRLVMCP